MTTNTTGSELSPLDQIRQTETNITRQIAAARVSVGRSVEDARIQATQIKRQAQEKGWREGHAVYNDILLQAEEKAHIIVAHAKQWADEIQLKAEQQMEQAVKQAVLIVIDPEGNVEDR